MKVTAENILQMARGQVFQGKLEWPVIKFLFFFAVNYMFNVLAFKILCTIQM